jgi:hypothetical protein
MRPVVVLVVASLACGVLTWWAAGWPAGSDDPPPASTQEARDGPAIWISAEEIATLPTRGPAWRTVRGLAHDGWGEPDLGDNDDDHDVRLLAGALVAERLDDAAMREDVVEGLEAVTGTFPEEVLPLARNISAYVVAARIVGHRTPEFETWLDDLVDARADGRAGIGSLRESAMTDPSNHGNHARASLFAIARYLGDRPLEREVAARFRDWLGRSGRGFEWKDRSWQADPSSPRGVNPAGSRIGGMSVDGILPEEQRRSGTFDTNPEREPYVWEGLQGVTAAAAMMDRAGYAAWQWEDCAILRAFRWLHEDNDFPAEGDDVWQSWLVNHAYGTDFPAASPTAPGKNLGFTDWTHRAIDGRSLVEPASVCPRK